MDGDEENVGLMFMDISDGDLFSVFGEEWAIENLMEPLNRTENDGRVGGNDGRVGEYSEADEFLGLPEWREPF